MLQLIQEPSRTSLSPVPEAPPLKGTVVLNPKLLVQLLVARSPEIRHSRLQVEVAGHMRQAEAALYEGVLFGSVRQEDRERQRSVVERQSSFLTANLAVLDERVETAELGLRNRTSTGGEVALSYRLRDTRNNIISRTTGERGEFDGAMIITLKQPLLRGRGRDVIETDLRIAELEERVSFMQFKQQVLRTCSDALGLYWQFYRAREVLRIREQALENARQILRDTEARVEAGRLPESNILEATAAVTVRDVERIRAEQGLREAESRLLTLLNISGLEEGAPRLVPGTDPPGTFIPAKPLAERFAQALEAWPDYQIARLKLEQGRHRLNFADNQRLPALDLQISRSRSGLAYRRDEVHTLIHEGQFPEWFIGLNMEVPIWGNQKANSQYHAQLVRVRQAETEIEAVRNALANELRARLGQLEAARREVEHMKKDVELRRRIFENERVRYAEGIGLLSQLLQREAELTESRQRMIESNVRLGQAEAALMFVDGSLLEQHGITVKD